MHDASEELLPDVEATAPLPDEGTVAYIERLLAAIERLRAERDDLRGHVDFLESESRFTVEALEQKLQLSQSTTANTLSGEDATQMQMELDELHSHLADVQANADMDRLQKEGEIVRIGRAVLALAVVLGHQIHSTPEAEANDSLAMDSTRLAQLEDELQELRLQHEDVVDQLRKKEEAWEAEVQTLLDAQQESNRTIEDLTSNNSDLRETLDRVESERHSFTIQIQNLETELDDAQREVALAETRFSDLQYQVDSMSSSDVTHKLRTQISQLEGRVERRNEQLGIHQHDIRRLETNLRLQEERLNEMTSELEMMGAEKEAMVADCADAREVRDDALRRVEQMEEQHETLEAAVEEGDMVIHSLIGTIFDTVSKGRQALANAAASQQSGTDRQDTVDLMNGLKADDTQMEHSIQVHDERIAELTARISELEAQLDSVTSRNGVTVESFETRLATLQGEIDTLQRAKVDLERTHSDATRELQAELELLSERLIESEDKAHSDDQAEKEHPFDPAEVQRLESRLCDAQQALVDLEEQHAGELEKLHHEIETLADGKVQVENEMAALQDRLSSTETEHQRSITMLQAELVKEKENLAQAQHSFDTLEQERLKLSEDIRQLEEALRTTQDELAVNKDNAAKSKQQHGHELDALTAQINELSLLIREEQTSRQADASEHQATVSSLKDQHNAEVVDLKKDLQLLREDYDETDKARLSAEEDRNNAQEQLIDLIAKLEQSKSLQRSFEMQIEER